MLKFFLAATAAATTLRGDVSILFAYFNPYKSCLLKNTLAQLVRMWAFAALSQMRPLQGVDKLSSAYNLAWLRIQILKKYRIHFHLNSKANFENLNNA